MFWSILKKDLKRKKSINIILLLFIVLATTFLGSSISNVILIKGATKYYLDKARQPDLIITANNTTKESDDKMNSWLKKSELVKEYEKNEVILIDNEDIRFVKSKENIECKENSSLIVQKLPSKYMKVFNENGEEINLDYGEIAIPVSEKNKNDLEIGDTVIIDLEDIKKEFKIAYFIKDATFGAKGFNSSRTIINDKEYEELSSINNVKKAYIYGIISDDINKLQKEFRNEDISGYASIDRSSIEIGYTLEMLTSVIIIIFSICLILISFLILRFTIVFTIEDDYKEIGIMKAIGLKNFAIRKIYLVKYLIISSVAAIIGCILSFPFGEFFMRQVSNNMLIKNSTSNSYINILSAILVVIIVMLFCYKSTGKLNKISAIDTIRKGRSQEGFKRKSILKLNNQKVMKTSIYMAINDILSNLRSYIVLILTFSIGTILIILPLNVVNTLKDGKTIELLSTSYSDVYIKPDNILEIIESGDKERYKKEIKDIEDSINNNGIPIDVYGQVELSLTYYSKDREDKINIRTYQSYNYDDNNYNFLQGTAPILENEISLTEISAKKLNVGIGDIIYLLIDDSEKPFIVTGLYQSVDAFGDGARINNKVEISYKKLSRIAGFQGNFIGDVNKENEIQKLKELYPKYEFKTAEEYASDFLGENADQMERLKNIVIIIIIIINALVTIMTMKTFVIKEKGEIAFLKSIGFRNLSIKLWQSYRIFIILVISIILGVSIASLIGNATIGKAFSLVGATQIKLTIIPEEVYFFYPLLILLITSIIAFVNPMGIRKIDIKEINNIE